MDNLSYVRELLDELSAFNNAGRVKPEATDTGMYLKTVLSSVKPTLDYLDIRLVTDIPNDLPTLMLDRIQIRQMLLNLLKNAAFTEKSGICINIQDNGCGISKEQLASIFQPFFTTKENGTGLGLAISRQVAEAHHGSISIESTPGQGTVFHIFLG